MPGLDPVSQFQKLPEIIIIKSTLHFIIQLEDLTVLKRSPDLLKNVKIGQDNYGL